MRTQPPSLETGGKKVIMMNDVINEINLNDVNEMINHDGCIRSSRVQPVACTILIRATCLNRRI